MQKSGLAQGPKPHFFGPMYANCGWRRVGQVAVVVLVLVMVLFRQIKMIFAESPHRHVYNHPDSSSAPLESCKTVHSDLRCDSYVIRYVCGGKVTSVALAALQHAIIDAGSMLGLLGPLILRWPGRCCLLVVLFCFVCLTTLGAPVLASGYGNHSEAQKNRNRLRSSPVVERSARSAIAPCALDCGAWWEAPLSPCATAPAQVGVQDAVPLYARSIRYSGHPA